MIRALTLATLALLHAPGALAQTLDDAWLETFEWRNIGPSRGGRSSTSTGVRGDPLTYYFGGTGGGVWKTTNAGTTWNNVSDDSFNTGSVGAIAVSESDPNVVYVGMGEPDIRGNFSHGDGVYKSTDAGKTWEHMGLGDSRQIGRIVVHPRDPDLVYVAALGHIFGPNAERGVYRSDDGGKTWQRTLYVDDLTGAVDISMDPFNARIMYAGMWQVSRTPWSMDSGGEGSGLYRSTDAGETWEELTSGLPEGVKGKVGVSASGAQRDRVFAIIEADDGGVFRSDDAGDTWTRVNEDRSLRQRAWYYSRIMADPQDADTVYVMNVQFHKSIDGGRNYSTIRVPHGDNHWLWIDPDNNQRMINSNDGGGNVSFDGGATWTDQTRQPTSQFYRVTVDNSFPYRVYGAQQDNSTITISSRNRLGRWQRDWYPIGGGESGYIAVRPDDPDIVYAGSYGGWLTRYDHDLGKSRGINVWPENPMGDGPAPLRHRFQWTFPIIISPHDHDTVYVGGERLFKTTDGGQSWDAISPDLTTNDKLKQASSGGPITQDNTSVEYYCTIFTVAESPLEAGLIWTGSDDGLVHVTSNAGESWDNVTPDGMGDWPMISLIEASPHDADTAYAAVNRYKMDDFRPYIYRTRDRGATWDLIVDGIDSGAFVRSIREDPVREGLLYAATETGVWMSLDAGESWQSMQMNLPRTPVTDVVVKDDDLVIATQGRSFWILSGLGVLRQLDEMADADDLPATLDVALLSPPIAYRQRWDRVRLTMHMPEERDEDMSLAILDDGGEVLREYEIKDSGGQDAIGVSPGMNQWSWDMRLERATRVPGAVGWPGMPSGPRVPPGSYTVELRAGDETIASQEIEILGDPRIDTTADEYAEQYAFLLEINEAIDEAHTGVNTIRAIRSQIDSTLKRAAEAELDEDLKEAADAIKETITEIETAILQTKSKSSQDPLNFPVRLNDKIAALAFQVDGDYPPTRQSRDVFEHLRALLDEQLDRLDTVLDEDVPAFNDLVAKANVPAVVLDEPDKD